MPKPDMGKTIPFKDEAAYCSLYAVDPNLGLVVVFVLTTAQELGLRIAARLVGGQEVLLADGTVLKRQKANEIPLLEEESVTYKPAYARTHPLRLETGVGYETCVLHRDATMQAAFGHWGYLLRLPGGSNAHFWARFFHLWGAVTGLPARPAWAQALWGLGLKLELIVPLKAFGCEGWRIDPRCDRPDGAGWREVLKTITLLEEKCTA